MELQEAYTGFKELGAEIIAISVDDAADALAMVETHGLEFPVLYDTDASVARAWRVFDLLGDGVAAPAVFIVERGGELAWAQVGRDIADRPEPQALLASLEAMNALAAAVTEDPVQPTAAAVAPPTAMAAPEGPTFGPGVHDFTLPTALGGDVSLGDYLGKKHVVLVFYRGFW